MWALLISLGLVTGISARDRIAYIEFFGYQGIDVTAVRNALPLHDGDNFSRDLEIQARAAVKQVTGHEITDFAAICCTGDSDRVVSSGYPALQALALSHSMLRRTEMPPPRTKWPNSMDA
ncbi:MAG TPA: hypothetical protein VGF16_00190 [Bryobacteraceae bacterium]|jgi:hypothetical protein